MKTLWTQLCGDLIAIGVPPLLHALHVRNGDQEDNEVRKRLWAVVAEKGPSISADIKWQDLIQYLAMPFG